MTSAILEVDYEEVSIAFKLNVIFLVGVAFAVVERDLFFHHAWIAFRL